MRIHKRVTIGMVLAGVAAQSMAVPVDNRQIAQNTKPAVKASCIKASLLKLTSSSKDQTCDNKDTPEH